MQRKALGLPDLPSLVIAFVIGFIVLGFGVKIIADIGAGLPFNSYAYNVTTNATAGAVNISAYAPTIGTVLAGAIVIGILISAFMKQE